MNSQTCSSCGHKLSPENKKCPNCGSGDRHVQISDEGVGMDSLGIKEKGLGFPRFRRLRKFVDKISGKTKRRTREYLEIDREQRHKIHHVEEREESGRWVTVHDENKPLDQVPNKISKSEQRKPKDKVSEEDVTQ